MLRHGHIFPEVVANRAHITVVLSLSRIKRWYSNLWPLLFKRLYLKNKMQPLFYFTLLLLVNSYSMCMGTLNWQVWSGNILLSGLFISTITFNIRPPQLSVGSSKVESTVVLLPCMQRESNWEKMWGIQTTPVITWCTFFFNPLYSGWKSYNKLNFFLSATCTLLAVNHLWKSYASSSLM